MKCTTELHGDVCHGTSIVHKSGNNIKRKKKTSIFSMYYVNIAINHDEVLNITKILVVVCL